MLISLSTLLARAHRRKHAVIRCQVASLEIAQACLEGAAGEGIALEVSDRTGGVLPPRVLLDAVTHLAHTWGSPVSVIACVAPQETAVGLVLDSGISAVRFDWEALQAAPRRKDLTRWAARAAHRHGVEVIGMSGSSLTPLRLRTFAQDTGSVALLLEVDPTAEAVRALTPGYAHELAQGAAVPLLLPELPLSLAQRKRFIQSGLHCFCTGEELEQAYTAGLRTALRDRSQWRVGMLAAPAVQAVRQAVREQLRNLGTSTNHP